MTYLDKLTAIADPTRRRILENLRGGPHSVNALAAVLPVSRPAVSQHLKVLKAAGLVDEARMGNRHIFSLKTAGASAVVDYLEWLFSAPDGRR